MVEVGVGNGAQRLADEIGEVAGEHAARRAVHPGDAMGVDGHDADEDRVEDGAGAVGLQREVPLGAVAGVDVHEGGNEALFGARGVDQAHGDFGPDALGLTLA